MFPASASGTSTPNYGFYASSNHSSQDNLPSTASSEIQSGYNSSDNLPHGNRLYFSNEVGGRKGSFSRRSFSSQSVSSSASTSLLKKHSMNSFARLLVESVKCNGITDLLSLGSGEGGIGGERKKHGLLYRFFQLIIIFFRCITPFAYLYFIILYFFPALFYRFFAFSSILAVSFSFWMLLEVAFFPYYYAMFRFLNNSLNYELKHLCIDKKSRTKLVKNCFEGMALGAPSTKPQEVHLRAIMERWFLDESILNINFGNIAAWTAWAFFGKDIKQMSEEEVLENNDIVYYMSKMLNWQFPKGYNSNLPGITTFCLLLFLS
jgi:hypothetical protein